MVGAGVPRLVVSKILNHVETGVTAVYDRHGYDLEKRACRRFSERTKPESKAPRGGCWQATRWSGFVALQ